MAAAITPGDRVLSVGCGAGAELRLWAEAFGAAEVVGIEARQPLVDLARQVAPAALVRLGSATALAELGLGEGRFDRVLCVDAAYHFEPRRAFLKQALRLLRPGGRLACCDLVASRAPTRWRASALSVAARACGLPGAPPGEAMLRDLWCDAGFEAPGLTRLDEPVLGGFADFVRRHEARIGRARFSRAWQRPALTARMIGPARAAGLGYVLLAARRPASSIAAATA